MNGKGFQKHWKIANLYKYKVSDEVFSDEKYIPFILNVTEMLKI